eukprot:5302067-Alexandrium_andersonii.AAC.1
MAPASGSGWGVPQRADSRARPGSSRVGAGRLHAHAVMAMGLGQFFGAANAASAGMSSSQGRRASCG